MVKVALSAKEKLSHQKKDDESLKMLQKSKNSVTWSNEGPDPLRYMVEHANVDIHKH